MEDRDAYHRRIKQQTAKCAATHRRSPAFAVPITFHPHVINNYFKIAQVRSHVAVKSGLTVFHALVASRLHAVGTFIRPVHYCSHKWQQQFSSPVHSKG
jgi:hypothetical protein